jgi:hypothetical protein
MRVGVTAAAIVFMLMLPAPRMGSEASAAESKHCRNSVLVYVDFSETISGSVTGSPQVFPLSKIANMLRLLLLQKTVLRDGDALTVIAFGASVRPLYFTPSMTDTERIRLGADFEQLAGRAWPEAEIIKSSLPDLEQFRVTTDFGAVFADLASRLSASGYERQVVLLASDFAHDQDNDCSAEAHITDFETKFQTFAKSEVLQRFAPSAGVPSAQLMLLKVQPVVTHRCKITDVTVAAHVLERFRRLNPHEIEDVQQKSTEELGHRVEENFSSSVVIRNPRKTLNGKIEFTIENPNCTDVTIAAVHLESGRLRLNLDLTEPVHLGDKEISSTIALESPNLTRFNNQFVDITPQFGDAKTAATRFWMGDIIHVERMTPRLFPRLAGDGRVVLLIETTISAEKERKYTVTILRPPGAEGLWSNEILVSPTGNRTAKRVYEVPFEAASEAINQLATLGSVAIDLRGTDGGRAVVGGDKEHGDSQRPQKGLDGKIKEYAAPMAGLVFATILLYGRIRGIPFRQSLAIGSDLSTLVNSGLAVSAFAIAATNVLALPLFGGTEASFSVPSFIVGGVEASALALVVFFTGRTYVLAVYWPRLQRHEIAVTEAHERRVAMERLIVRGSFITFIIIWAIFLYYTPPTALAVMRAPS